MNNYAVSLLILIIISNQIYALNATDNDVNSTNGATTKEFNAIDNIDELKKNFINYLLPLINEQNDKILNIRTTIKQQKLSETALIALAKKYKTTPAMLLDSVDIIPPSIALAQAALESNWGRARFTKYNNYYGIWCFKVGCGVVPKNRDLGDKHEVATFDTVEDSINYYMWTLNSNSAYTKFRNIRKNMRLDKKSPQGIDLADGLQRYSQNGKKYIKNIKEIINYNKLFHYD